MSKILFLDLETTGLEYLKSDRIIEFYGSLRDLDTRRELAFINQRFDPEGRAIDPKAMLIHRIAPMDLVGKPSFRLFANVISRLCEDADLIVAHNGAGFDMPFLAIELQRAGAPIPETPCFDTMLEAPWATDSGKRPSLKELCYALDVDYDDSQAHTASYDVGVMAECFFRGVEWGGFHHGLK